MIVEKCLNLKTPLSAQPSMTRLDSKRIKHTSNMYPMPRSINRSVTYLISRTAEIIRN